MYISNLITLTIVSFNGQQSYLQPLFENANFKDTAACLILWDGKGFQIWPFGLGFECEMYRAMFLSLELVLLEYVICTESLNSLETFRDGLCGMNRPCIRSLFTKRYKIKSEGCR